VLQAQARPRTTTSAAQSRTAAAAAALARAGDAVVTIVAYRDGTSAVSSGVGVRLTDGRVVTSLRYLRGANRAEVFGAEGDLLATVTTLEQAETKLDLAVFPRIASTGENLLLARRTPLLASKVNLLGPRKATLRSVTERTITHVEPDGNGRPLLRLGAPVPSGAAGSPVVNLRNELVGIALGTIPGRNEGDIAVDVSAVRELLARPITPLTFPSRDGVVVAAKGAADSNAGVTSASGAVRSRGASIFPERYGAPIGTDTVRAWTVELYGCARLESRQKVYCYLRITNLMRGATFELNGGDLADSTRRKLRAAENLLLGETVQRVAGWRKKASVPLRELESARFALEFTPPERESEPLRLMVDIAGERAVWFGPFVLQRAP
jgi:S1-C subfamily serine protease